jgi:protein transport protein SEC31
VNTEDLLDATPTEVSSGAASDTSIVTPLPDAESITTAPSLFGDDGPASTPQLDAAADFFSSMGISRSTIEAVPGCPAHQLWYRLVGGRHNRLLPRTLSKAILPTSVGDFEGAVSLCLSVERFADAILLAVKGGPDSGLLARSPR